MSGWKYTLHEGKMGMMIPIIFPEILVHKDISIAVQRAGRELNIMEPVSAGFVDGLCIASTSGESETLGLKVRPEDASIINTNPYTKGIVTPLMVKIEKMLLSQSIELLKKRLRILQDLDKDG